MIPIEAIELLEKRGELFTRDLSDVDKAMYVRRHGRERYHQLPFAPFPEELVQEQGLRRSQMSASERVSFVKQYGQENLDKVPF